MHAVIADLPDFAAFAEAKDKIAAEKERALAEVATAREIHRVLKPGGEVHVADWGRPSNRIMRGLFFAIQLLDGFENPRGHVDGRLEALFKDAGFGGVRATQSFDTVYGTLVLYRAHRTGQP